MHLEIADHARRDLDDLYAGSEERFGVRVADRYRRLVTAALRDLRTDHRRLGVSARDDLPDGLRVYHLRFSRKRLPSSQRIANPRHFIVFRIDGDKLRVVRVLHDAMDLERHVVNAAEE